jgi:hypothetical protein
MNVQYALFEPLRFALREIVEIPQYGSHAGKRRWDRLNQSEEHIVIGVTRRIGTPISIWISDPLKPILLIKSGGMGRVSLLMVLDRAENRVRVRRERPRCVGDGRVRAEWPAPRRRHRRPRRD